MRSTGYTFGFAAAVCIACSLVVSSAASLLRDRQAENVRMDIQKNILSAVGLLPEGKVTPEALKELYTSRIEERVVDAEGNAVPDEKASELDPKTDAGLLPVFVRKDGNAIGAYAIPISGKGLWSTIYGYLALKPDCVTVKGITFYQHGETPGLGGEIDKSWFTDNFKGKRIVDATGKLTSVEIIKGKVADSAPAGRAIHCVDGISGATLTTKGVSTFIRTDLERYEGFFGKLRPKRKQPKRRKR
ncbi:NADH:ubiquinone reductase (Na(+)-transporting) subunit C [Elusimicrobiota bacterium]